MLIVILVFSHCLNLNPRPGDEKKLI